MVKLAMDHDLDYTVLRDFIYTHPTMSEGLNDLPSSCGELSLSESYRYSSAPRGNSALYPPLLSPTGAAICSSPIFLWMTAALFFPICRGMEAVRQRIAVLSLTLSLWSRLFPVQACRRENSRLGK